MMIKKMKMKIKKMKIKEQENEASLDLIMNIDEYKLDEQLIDTDSDQQSSEQVITKKK